MQTPTQQETAPIVPPAPKKKKRRRKKKDKAVKEIIREQARTENIIPAAPMKRLIQEILAEYNPEYRITKKAFQAICADAEMHAIETFTKANALAIHAGRQTVAGEDFALANNFNNLMYPNH